MQTLCVAPCKAPLCKAHPRRVCTGLHRRCNAELCTRYKAYKAKLCTSFVCKAKQSKAFHSNLFKASLCIGMLCAYGMRLANPLQTRRVCTGSRALHGMRLAKRSFAWNAYKAPLCKEAQSKATHRFEWIATFVAYKAGTKQSFVSFVCIPPECALQTLCVAPSAHPRRVCTGLRTKLRFVRRCLQSGAL